MKSPIKSGAASGDTRVTKRNTRHSVLGRTSREPLRAVLQQCSRGVVVWEEKGKMMFTGLVVVMAAIIGPIAVDAVGSPVGFGAGTTGGHGGTTVTPTTLAQLRSYLCESLDSNGDCNDGTSRIIIIDRTFDFRNSQGRATETGCIVANCPNAREETGLNESNYCTGKTSTSVTYDVAGAKHPLIVGSNKTILGVGRSGIIKGVGFKLKGGVSNIIIQNIDIIDINDGIVWGGDAISIVHASNVWIDHNYFARIGRQMIVTGFGTASHVTISNNIFDGNTDYSATCDGDHYWLWLFLGAADTITLYRNYIHDTSGRGPHSGGLNDATVRLHMVNNYFKGLTGQGAIMSRTSTSYILAEGNYFLDVTYPVYDYKSQVGLAYTPFTASAASACSSHISRGCVVNHQIGSSSNWNYTPLDTVVLDKLSAYSSRLITPDAVNTVPRTVLVNAGVGKIN